MRRARGLCLSTMVCTAIAAAACRKDDSPPPLPVEPASAPHEVDGGGAEVGDGGVALADPCRGVALPADGHFVAEGLCARQVAAHQGELRQITFAPNGDLYGVTVTGVIKRYRDANHDGVFTDGAPEVIVWGNTGSDEHGNDVAIDAAGGYLYAGVETGVKRWKWAPDADAAGASEDVVVGATSNGTHKFHTVHVYDGMLWVHSGAENNAVNPRGAEYDDDRALIRRFDLSKLAPGAPFVWTSGEIVSRGVRNAVGFARNAAGTVFAVVNGADNVTYGGVDVHLDNPGDQLIKVESGTRYGYPFCMSAVRVLDGARIVPPGTMLPTTVQGADLEGHVFDNPHDAAWCSANADRPSSLFQAHSAALDLTFFEREPAGNLPERYRGGAFVSLHGSWNRVPSTGYKIVWMPIDGSGNAPMPTSTATETTFPYQVVFGGGSSAGPKDGAWGWAGEKLFRPIGVAVSPIDGALYVSSDNGAVFMQADKGGDGALYRIGVRR